MNIQVKRNDVPYNLKGLGTDCNAALWLCEVVGAVFGLEKPRSECTRLPPTGTVQCQV